MNAALIAEIVGYLIKYGPAGVNIVTNLIAGVKNLTKNGHVPTNEELKALSDKIQRQHDALPIPD